MCRTALDNRLVQGWNFGVKNNDFKSTKTFNLKLFQNINCSYLSLLYIFLIYIYKLGTRVHKYIVTI